MYAYGNEGNERSFKSLIATDVLVAVYAVITLWSMISKACVFGVSTYVQTLWNLLDFAVVILVFVDLVFRVVGEVWWVKPYHDFVVLPQYSNANFREYATQQRMQIYLSGLTAA